MTRQQHKKAPQQRPFHNRPTQMLPHFAIVTFEPGVPSEEPHPSIAFTNSWPCTTSPKTVCFPFRCGVGTVVMKNCDPFLRYSCEYEHRRTREEKGRIWRLTCLDQSLPLIGDRAVHAYERSSRHQISCRRSICLPFPISRGLVSPFTPKTQGTIA